MSSGPDALRLLHFADLHLDTAFGWAPPQVGSLRRQALREALRAICQTARDHHVDLLTCAGDLYEQDRFTPDTAAFLVSAFSELGDIPVLIAPGNHDWYSPNSVYATAAFSPNVHVFKNDHLEPREITSGVTIWGAAHRAPANTDDFLLNFRTPAGGLNFALFHGSERYELAHEPEGKEPHATFSASEIGASGFAHALLGHFHQPVDAANYTYPGNPAPLSFGEHGPRGAVLFELRSDGTFQRQRIKVAQSVLEDVHIDVTGSASLQDVVDRFVVALGNRTGIARAFLAGDVAATAEIDMNVLRNAARSMQYIAFDVAGIRPTYDLDQLRAERTVRGQFVRDVMDAEMIDDERRRVLITGLRALAGRKDLEVF
jgi:exonuclease SbcD